MPGEIANDATSAVQRGLEHFHQTAAERTRLEALCAEQEHEISLLRQQNEAFSFALTKAQAERDHYMAALVEASTQLTSAHAFLSDAVSKVRNAPFRRVGNGASGTESVARLTASEESEIRSLATRLAPNRDPLE